MDDMDTNLADFADSLGDLGQSLGDLAQAAVRDAVTVFRDKVAARTPVKTGRARAGWLLTVDETSDEVPPPGDYPDAGGQDAQDIPLAQSYYCVQNNLDYISDLEDGTSTQAPQGMVALSLAEFDDDLAQAVENLGLEGA